MPYTYDYFQKSVDYLKEKVDFTPEIAIILGSCLGPFAEEIENPIVVDYKDIPNFLVSTVASHAGKLIFGTVCGRKVVCMSGRFHSYEGYDFEQLVIPIRVFKLLGVQKTIITNAAGAVNTGYRPGDDHFRPHQAGGPQPPPRPQCGGVWPPFLRCDPDVYAGAAENCRGLRRGHGYPGPRGRVYVLHRPAV